MRALGHGHTGLSTFCGIMDLPPAIAPSAYDKINDQLRDICSDTAQELMNRAVKEEVQLSPPNTELTVSGDGTWRKRGFSSLKSVASIIGNRSGKVLDVVIKNSFCKPCSVWEKREVRLSMKNGTKSMNQIAQPTSRAVLEKWKWTAW